MSSITHRIAMVDGVKVVYREAGDPTAPTLVLLHGFACASQMCRDVMVALADRFHVVAPQFRGCGQGVLFASQPARLSFDDVAGDISGFVNALGLKKFAMYVFDYDDPSSIAGIGSASLAETIAESAEAYLQRQHQSADPLDRVMERIAADGIVFKAQRKQSSAITISAESDIWQDSPSADVCVFEDGEFGLERHCPNIAEDIRGFVARSACEPMMAM